MNEPPKRSLADDPSFAASLDQLDRGLAGDNDDSADVALRMPVPKTRAEPGPEPTAIRSARVRPPFGEPLRVPPVAQPLAPTAPAPGPRNTKFPLVAIGSERPPGPFVGTAVGPQVPRGTREHETSPPAPQGPLTYETFYGLREKPFSLSPDPKFLFRSTSHDRAEQALLGAVHRRDGLVVLTGELGMGKTTLCRAFVEQLDRHTLTSMLLGEALLSVDDFLKTILVDFGVITRDDVARVPHVARAELTAALDWFVESLVPLQACAIVIVDEAQNLPPAVLDEIFAVTAAGQEAQRLQLVLVGKRSLDLLLVGRELAEPNGRVAVKSELGPLAADEVSGYVRHRLGVAGASPRVDFSDAACARIHEVSAGVPRVMNLLCDRALSRGHRLSASVIDATLVDAAVEDLDLGTAVAETRTVIRALVTVLALIALMFVGAAGALWVFRADAARTFAYWQNVPPAPGEPALRLPMPLAPIPPPPDPIDPR